MAKTLVKKFDNNKPSFTAIPKKALRELAVVFTYGKNKYGKFNYSGKIDLTRYLDALHRHLNSYEISEDLDPETKVNHLAHVAANALMALDGLLTGNVVDDRNKVYKKKKK